MSKVLHSRVFRLLVCLILVAAFLINLSPLKAEATAVVGAALTFDGLMAALYSLSIGICATAFTVDVWNKVGQTFRKVVTDTGDSTITEAWVDLEAMYDAYIPGGGQDPDDELKWAEKLKTALSRGLLGAIAGWLCTLVNMGGYEVEGDSASTSWSYYGEYYLPTFPVFDEYPYMYLRSTYSDQRWQMRYCSVPVFDASSGTSIKYKTLQAGNGFFHNLTKSTINDDTIVSFEVPTSPTSYSAGQTVDSNEPILWANFDVFSYTDGTTLVFAGSEPTTTKTEILEPTIYVGDIPQQIQDGDKDKDDLVLPIIDPFRVIQSPSTALDDMNQLQQQLQAGTTTLDQYLEQVQLQEPTIDPDPPATDPSSPTSPSTGTEPWEPPEDPGNFALDLSKVFPFCIPFDLYAFLTCLNADPVTPVIHWEIAMPGGGSYPLTIDLSPFDSVAQLLRRLELLLFCIGLAIKTRDLIKG